MSTRIVRHPAAERSIKEALGHGLLYFGFAVESAWKRDVVVRGGNRSFMTDLTKAGTPRVGGTLRRSIHTVLYQDGRRIAAGTAASPNSGVDGKTGEDIVVSGVSNEIPSYDPGDGIRVFVGTNSGYGAYVELGTSKMPARPAGVPAVQALRGQAPALIATGARKQLAR